MGNLVVNSQPIPRLCLLQYLGVTMSEDLKWTAQIKAVFCKVRKLTYVVRRLRSFATPRPLVIKFVEGCILPLWTYCSPVVFAALLKQDFKTISRSLVGIARCSGIPLALLQNNIVTHHIKSCRDFGRRILDDPTHPLFLDFQRAVSCPSTRSHFHSLRARTTAYNSSVLPNTVRTLMDPIKTANELMSRLSV